jgi:DNA primase catalytic subunit
MPAVLPAKNANVALRGHARALICEALRDGPKTRREIVAYVVTKRPELSYQVAYHRTDRILWRMGKAGALVNEGGVWRLAP